MVPSRENTSRNPTNVEAASVPSEKHLASEQHTKQAGGAVKILGDEHSKRPHGVVHKQGPLKKQPSVIHGRDSSGGNGSRIDEANTYGEIFGVTSDQLVGKYTPQISFMPLLSVLSGSTSE